MSKIACVLAALMIAQASSSRAPQVVSEREPSEFGRTSLSIFHVHSKDGFTCATHAAGNVCSDVSHWAIALRSNEYTIETIGVALAQDAALRLEDADPKVGRRLSKRDLVIRADPTAPYGFTQPVIQASYAAGFYKIALAIGGSDLETVEDLRIALFWDSKSKSAIRRVGTRTINDDADLRNLLTEARENALRTLRSQPRVMIDAAMNVPWSEIVKLVDLCRDQGVANVEFATKAK